MMEPASRMAARLAGLVDLAAPGVRELLEIAAAGCEASAEVKNRADAILAAHKPLEPKAVEGVLLSSDLVPHLLAPLQLEDGAAAAVCSMWAEAWKATSEGRRRLTRVPLDLPQDLLGAVSLKMAVVPGGDKLVVRSGTTVRILARDMNVVSSFEMPRITEPDAWGHAEQEEKLGYIAASAEFIYATETGSCVIRRFTHAGTEVAKYEDPDSKSIDYPVLTPGGLLFCLFFLEGDEQDEIVALDAQTLQPRHRFGLSLLFCARGLVVVGEELFVCDCGNDRLQVFSLAGEHRRSITGEWEWYPIALCFVKDRLYLVEEDFMYEGLQGRRIFVLSLQGETLQVYTQIEGHIFTSLCCFDGKLLAPVRDWSVQGITKEVVALCGV